MMKGAREKTIIAVLPAVIAFAVAVYVELTERNSEFRFPVIAGLLVLGGALAGTFITRSLARNRPDRGSLFLGFMFVLVFLGYIFLVFFMGIVFSFIGALR